MPCLVDQVYPEMAWSLVGILRHFGYEVKVEPRITCCGQPAFNSGQAEQAREVASSVLESLGTEGPIVCPSGSCTAMIRNFYTQLFRDTELEAAASALSSRIEEFSEFMTKTGLAARLKAKASGKVAFHNSCHSLRELGIEQAPMELLRRVEGIELVALDAPPACCGFGGLFSVKFAPIAAGMTKSRLETFADRGVETLVSNDPGCIMQLRQRLGEQPFGFEVLHLTEFLARAMGVAS